VALRNPGEGRQVAWQLALSAALALAALALSGPVAALWALAAGLAASLIALAASRARYRAIARMSERLDAVLHGSRQPSLAGADEGELAILASELDKVVSRLNLTAEALERESARLSDALADISHQLKTPLTSLSLMCELVRKRVVARGGALTQEEADEIAARLRTMQRLQERVQWLVASLLKLARIDAGVVRFARVRVEADRVIERAASTLDVAFDLAGVELTHVPASGAGFFGDPSWSAEALANVLKNCMEHTPSGGRVRVWATADALACRIHVQDTGPGIAEEDLPHVFERFYRGRQGEEASPTDPAGVGIGLSLARSLVTAQGGTIEARNARDASGRVTGARFDLIFFHAVV